jgi:hypothetical protein
MPTERADEPEVLPEDRPAERVAVPTRAQPGRAGGPETKVDGGPAPQGTESPTERRRDPPADRPGPPSTPRTPGTRVPASALRELVATMSAHHATY